MIVVVEYSIVPSYYIIKSMLSYLPNEEGFYLPKTYQETFLLDD